jgi:hypothetical protein
MKKAGSGKIPALFPVAIMVYLAFNNPKVKVGAAGVNRRPHDASRFSSQKPIHKML